MAGVGMSQNRIPRNSEAFFDAYVANVEHYHMRGRCLDCEVGEPHVCPRLFDPAGEKRRYQLLCDLEVLNGREP